MIDSQQKWEETLSSVSRLEKIQTSELSLMLTVDYGVARISKTDQILGLFYKKAL